MLLFLASLCIPLSLNTKRADLLRVLKKITYNYEIEIFLHLNKLGWIPLKIQAFLLVQMAHVTRISLRKGLARCSSTKSCSPSLC
jgi:hypothetical protein